MKKIIAIFNEEIFFGFLILKNRFIVSRDYPVTKIQA